MKNLSVLMVNIGNKIKMERTAKKISQNELASAIGTTQDSISLWETGKRLPDTHFIILLCKYFEVSSDYLLGLKEE